MVQPGNPPEPSMPTGSAVLLAAALGIVCALGGYFAGNSSSVSCQHDYEKLKQKADDYAKQVANHGRDEFNRGYESGKMFQVAEAVHAKAAEYQLDKATGKPRLVYKTAKSACQCVACNCK